MIELFGVVVLRDLDETLVLVFFGGLEDIVIGREVVRGAIVGMLGHELSYRTDNCEPLSLIELDVFSFVCVNPRNSWNHAFLAGRGSGCGC